MLRGIQEIAGTFWDKFCSVFYIEEPRNVTDYLSGDKFTVPSLELDLDINRVTRRVNRAFFPEITGPPPFTPIFYVHIILVIGLLVGLLYLFLALLYYTMQSLRALCPNFSFRIRRKNRRKRKGDLENSPPKEVLTPELLEERRQERLRMLQQEVDHLEDQLQNEKTATLTSRASDSDLEYLGFMDEDSPPLKRNSISLQDIPQSVIKIRREKQLRQLKQEIDNLQAHLSQSEDLDKEPSTKSPLLQDLKFVYTSSSKSSSPSPVNENPEHLSQRISHLKAHRRLQEIRADLEDLAMHLVHSDDIKAKTSSLQDLPRTALGAQRQEKLITLAKEVEHVKNYKLQHNKSILQTVFPDHDEKSFHKKKNEVLEKLNAGSKKERELKEQAKSPSQVPLLSKQGTTESQMSNTSIITTSSGGNPHSILSGVFDPCPLQPSASIKRTRQQELRRVKVELMELSQKLNFNYVFDNVDRDREKIMGRQMSSEIP